MFPASKRFFKRLVQGLFLIACLMLTSLAYAQSNLNPLTEAKLHRLVHLQLGKTTVNKVMSALSAQTGIKFEAVVYLEDRAIIVQMDNLPASAALEALTACHDWTWSEAERGHIVVRRPLPKVPRKPADIPQAVASCLPKDIRNFLTVELPTDSSLNVASLPNVPALRQNYTRKLNKEALQSKLQTLMISTAEDLINTLEPKVQKDAVYPYKQLSSANRDDILHHLLMASLKDLAVLILPDNLPSYVRDMSKTTIEIQNGGVFIGQHFDQGSYHHFEFFGGAQLPASILHPEMPAPEKTPSGPVPMP